MKKIIYTLGLLLIICSIQSCQKEKQLYQGETNNVSGIYFYTVATTNINGVPTSFRDSTTYSFASDPVTVTERNVLVTVRSLGNIADFDRPFKIKVVGGTAVEGVDFEKLPDTYIFPKDVASTRVPIKLLRTPKLMEKAVTIDIQLVENEYFKLLLPELKNIGDNKIMDATRFRIVSSEIIPIPFYYTFFGPEYFGDWSVKKFKILNDLMGWTTRDWDNAGVQGYPVAGGKFPYAATIFKEYLEKKLQENNPEYELDGKTLMQLGPAYMVDYSNYQN